MILRPSKHLARMAVVLTALLLASPAAFAYLDPSTGSMIVSAIIGIFASVALAVKTYWYKLKGLFRRKNDSTSGAAGDGSGEV